ncbi:MAG: hypothetical protein DBX97_01960 [Collinsella tanakaei]|nr:MAG: hypothetical protein DBX97_01960 [Collinsella tanakaei]
MGLIRNFRKRAAVDNVCRIIFFILMALFAFTYLFMFVWIFCNSMRTADAFILNTFDIFNFESWTFGNYQELFRTQIAGSQRNPIYLMDTVLTTVILVIGQVTLGVTIPALTGYIAAKYKFALRKAINAVAIIQMIVPTVGAVATTYRMMSKLNLTNSYLGIFLMSAGGFGFSFLLFKNFFASIPWSYAESAFIDGASDLRVFITIIYPQALPIITAIAVTTFIGSWNDYFTAYMYLPDKPTVSLGVSQLYRRMQAKLQLPVAFAGMTILAGVSLVVFGIFNKFIMSNMSAGGLKG